MCAVCASFVPVAGSTVHGLLALGAVAGGAAVGSLAGFTRRPVAKDAAVEDLTDRDEATTPSGETTRGSAG